MRRTIKILLEKTSGFRSDILLICLTGLVSVVATLGMVYLSKTIIDVATGRGEGDMLSSVLMLVSVFIVIIIFGAVNSKMVRMTDIKIQTRLQKSLFTRLLDADPVVIEKYRSGDLVNRLELDVRETAKLLADTIPSALIAMVQLLTALVFFFILGKELAVITFCIMPFCLFIGKFYYRRMRKLTHEIRQTDGRIQSLMQEGISQSSTVKTLEASDYMTDKTGGMQSELYGLVKERTRYNVLSRTAVTTGFAFGYLAVFIWGAYGLRDETITFGLMAAFLQLAGQVQRPVVGLAAMLPSLISGVTSIERLNEVEDIPTEEQGESIILAQNPGVKFINVSFGYAERDKPVFENFSFDFRPATSTAIVGETGAGKTSLIRLMLGLRRPDGGTISVYDHREEYSVSALTRVNFVYVPQGKTLFSGTIRENLLIAKPDATEAEMVEALKIACADFVFDLPEGLDTSCRESGEGLSEGQAERVTIARALLRPGNVLLLDEATSALDVDTEKALLQNIKTHTEHKTVIFITHRRVGCEFCDQVLKIVSPEQIV